MMDVTVKQNPGDYTIRHMMYRKTGKGDYQFFWDFNKASHFLVAAHPVKSGWGLEQDIVPWLSENGRRLLENSRIMEDGIIWNVIQEREFLAQNNKYIVQRSILKPGLPYRIAVYPCQIQGEGWDIYRIPDGDNVKAIPVGIRIEVTYKKPLFSPKQMCMFRVRFDADSLEGVLRYKPSGSRCQFPVSVECMKAARDGWICVCLPRDGELSITVAPEYKGYYNIKITGD